MSVAQHSTRSTELKSHKSTFLTGRQVSQQFGTGLIRQKARRTEAAFGRTKARASSQSYICRDCGYIYDERQSFESLDKSYRCPVCSSPKRRFTEYNAPVARGANNTSTRKERKAELQGSTFGLNPGIVIGVGLIVAIGAVTYVSLSY